MQNKMSQFEALCMALELAITAPTEKKSQQCVEMAEKVAIGMNEKEVERAKRLVVKRLNDKEN
jgi:hypothetical protein